MVLSEKFPDGPMRFWAAKEHSLYSDFTQFTWHVEPASMSMQRTGEDAI